jgi:hypothetical protein
MDVADKAVFCHELRVGGRPLGRIRPRNTRRVGLVEKSLAQAMTLIGGGIRRAPFANEAEAAINRTGIARSTGGVEPSWLGLSELHRPTRVAILRAELCQ